jgi:hypothetical protein
MRYTLIMLVLLGLACNKDDNGNDGFASHLELNTITEWLPEDHYSGKTKVIFKNASGDERVLHIKIESSEQDKSFEDREYTSERISYNLSEEDNDQYLIYYSADAQYDQNGHPLEWLSVTLQNQLTFPLSAEITIREGEHLLGERLDSVTLLDKTFDDVYISMDIPGFLRYNKIYYSAELGAVAFHDEYEDLWVYDRIE